MTTYTFCVRKQPADIVAILQRFGAATMILTCPAQRSQVSILMLPIASPPLPQREQQQG
jgi:hypothetical protein